VRLCDTIYYPLSPCQVVVPGRVDRYRDLLPRTGRQRLRTQVIAARTPSWEKEQRPGQPRGAAKLGDLRSF